MIEIWRCRAEKALCEIRRRIPGNTKENPCVARLFVGSLSRPDWFRLNAQQLRYFLTAPLLEVCFEFRGGILEHFNGHLDVIVIFSLLALISVNGVGGGEGLVWVNLGFCAVCFFEGSLGWNGLCVLLSSQRRKTQMTQPDCSLPAEDRQIYKSIVEAGDYAIFPFRLDAREGLRR